MPKEEYTRDTDMTLYYNLREGREVAVKLHNLNSETQVEERMVWWDTIKSHEQYQYHTDQEYHYEVSHEPKHISIIWSSFIISIIISNHLTTITNIHEIYQDNIDKLKL